MLIVLILLINIYIYIYIFSDRQQHYVSVLHSYTYFVKHALSMASNEQASNQDVEAWVNQYKQGQHASACQEFIDKTKQLLQGIVNWVPTDPKKTCGQSSFDSSTIVHFQEPLREIEDKIAAAQECVESARNLHIVEIKDTKWALTSASNEYFPIGRERKQLINLLKKTAYYVQVYNDIVYFCETVNAINNNSIQMEWITKSLWTTKITTIYHKTKEWFNIGSHLDDSPNPNPNDDFNDLDVFESHVKLFEAYYRIIKTNAQPDEINTDLLDQLENIKSNQKIIDIDRMHQWFGAVAYNNDFPDDNVIMQQRILDYVQLKTEMRQQTFQDIKSDVMKKLKKSYLRCLTLKWKSEDVEVDKIWEQHSQVEAAFETIKVFLSRFKIYLLQVIHFEKVKYMYLMLLLPLNKTAGNFSSIYSDLYDTYNRCQEKMDALLRDYGGDGWYFGMSGTTLILDTGFTEQDVLNHQLFGVRHGYIMSLQIHPINEALKEKKDHLFETLKSAILAHGNSYEPIYQQEFLSTTYLAKPFESIEKITTIQRIRNILCP